MNSANATVQLSTSPQVRGRVMSLYMMVFMGSTPIGSPLVGWIAETFGARSSVGVGAIASMSVALWSLWYARRHWDVHLKYQRHPRPHLLVESGPEYPHRPIDPTDRPDADGGGATTGDATAGDDAGAGGDEARDGKGADEAVDPKDNTDGDDGSGTQQEPDSR